MECLFFKIIEPHKRSGGQSQCFRHSRRKVRNKGTSFPSILFLWFFVCLFIFSFKFYYIISGNLPFKHSKFHDILLLICALCKLLISTLKIEVLQSNLIRLVMITKKSLEQSGSKGNCRSEEAHKMAERDIATNLKFACTF